ncbi:MAG: hypothetical protein AB1449_07590 [Chloroflexota bacterium]
MDDLLNLAERAYLRMQAGQLIAQCLEEGDPEVFDGLLQQLVLAGPSSLAALQEIREEIRSTSRSLRRAAVEVRKDLSEALAGLGVRLPPALTAGAGEIFRHLFRRTLREQVYQAAADLSPEDRRLVEDLCDEASQRVTAIAGQLALLSRLDGAVSDWLESIAYEAARLGPQTRTSSSLRLH